MAKKKAEKTRAEDKKLAASKKKMAYQSEEVEEVESEDGAEAEAIGNRSSKSKKSGSDDGGSVYKVIEVIGSSSKSWEDAAQVAIARASQTLDDLRVAEVVDQDLKIEDGAISAFRTKLRLSFKFREK